MKKFSMKTWFCLGYLLQFVFSVSYSQVPALITDCITKSTEPVYAEGDTFHLCCTLLLECDRTSVNDSVILAPFPQNAMGSREEDVYRRTGKCSARYTVKEAKVKDSQFHCFRNDPTRNRFAIKEINIIEKPRDVRLQRISVSEDLDINITLSYKCAGHYDEEVRMSMKEPWSSKETELCHEVQHENQYESKTCTCLYHNRQNSPMENRNVSLSVQVKRSWKGTADVSSEIEHYSVNWIDFVRPDPVMQLSLFNVSSDVVIVTFRVSPRTRNLMLLMTERNQTFTYHVMLINSLHPGEKLHFNISDLNDNQSNDSIAVWINGLFPFTAYTISVYCSGGGGAGDAQQIEFITGKSVPLQPPQVEQFIYRSQEHGSRINSSCIEFILQPFELSSRGGNNFHYRVELTSGKTYRSSYSCRRTCRVCAIPADTLSARFWSVNEIGKSRNHTDLVIPWNTGSARPTMFAELDGTKLHLTIRLTGQHQFINLTVLWCLGPPSMSNEGTEPFCYDVSKKVNISPDSKSVNSTLHVDLDLQNPNEELTSVGSFEEHTSTQVRYFCFDDVAQTFGVAKTVQAIRTKGKPLFDLLDREQNVRLRSETVKSFLSVKNGGQWMGMVEADCYFDSQSGFANIHLEHFFNESGTFIRLHQHCSKTPQFLAQSLEMYNSSDDQCLLAHKINEVASSLQAVIYKLPKDIMYVCIVAVAKNSTVKSRPYVLLVNRRDGSKDGALYLAVAVVASVVSVCIVGVVLSIVILRTKRNQCNRRTGVDEFIRVDFDERDTTDSSIPSQYKKVEHQDGASIETGGNDNVNSNDSDYLLLALAPPTGSNGSSVPGMVKESLGEQVSRGRELDHVLHHREYGQTNVHFVPLVENCANWWDSSCLNCTDETWNCKDLIGNSAISSVMEDSSGCTSGSSDAMDSRNCIAESSDVIGESGNCTRGSRQDVNDSGKFQSESNSSISPMGSYSSENDSDTSSSSDSTAESTICTINSGTNQEPSCGTKMDSTNAVATLVGDGTAAHYRPIGHLQQWTFQAPEGCGESCSEASDDDDSDDSTFYN